MNLQCYHSFRQMLLLLTDAVTKVQIWMFHLFFPAEFTAQQPLWDARQHIGNKCCSQMEPDTGNISRFCFNDSVGCPVVLNVTSIEINLLTLLIITICNFTQSRRWFVDVPWCVLFSTSESRECHIFHISICFDWKVDTRIMHICYAIV